MARVLWISDAGWNSGFSHVTHSVGERLVDDYGHDISVLAVGYEAKEPVSSPLKLYRASAGKGHHPMGFDRVLELLDEVEPDVVVVCEDPAILLKRLFENPWDPGQLFRQAVPIISYLPIDGVNLPPSWQQLQHLTNVVAMSRFGQEQFAGSKLIYHGVDTSVWHPVSPESPITLSTGQVLRSKAECRELFGVPQGAFVIGRVDSNTGRKDYGSTFRVVEGVRAHYDGEVFSFWHTRRDSPGGTDLEALVSRSDDGAYAITNSDDWPIDNMVAMVNCFDATLSTSRGEGFGLGLAQSLSCGVPVVATDCSSIPEVVGPGGICVRGQAYMTNPYAVDHMLADVPAMVTQLVLLARNHEERNRLGILGREHVKTNFSWDVAAGKFHPLIEALAAQAVAEPETAQRSQS